MSGSTGSRRRRHSHGGDGEKSLAPTLADEGPRERGRAADPVPLFEADPEGIADDRGVEPEEAERAFLEEQPLL